MLRFFLICLVLFFQVYAANSQKLHAFLFCKTNDNRIGTSVKINYLNVKRQLQMFAKALNYEFAEHSLKGNEFNANNVSNSITNTIINGDDIVFMYFSTHGGMTIHDSNIFPQLDIPRELVSVYKKHNEMLAKRPKFLLTAIEACSGYIDITPQETFIFEQGDEENFSDVPLPEQVNNIKQLFSSSSSCSYIITAGNPGKNTWATKNGSMFTNCFIRAINEFVNMPQNSMNKINWDNLFSQAQQYTSDMTRVTSIWYYPVWEKKPCTAFTSQQVNTKSDEKDVKFDIKVTKRRRLRNPYDVDLTINNNTTTSIDSVVYFLHETMEHPTVKVINASNKFFLRLAVWGIFPIKAKIYLHNGTILERYKNFSFRNREIIE